MRAYVINIMVVLIIFPVILQTVINLTMLSVRGQGCTLRALWWMEIPLNIGYK